MTTTGKSIAEYLRVGFIVHLVEKEAEGIEENIRNSNTETHIKDTLNQRSTSSFSVLFDYNGERISEPQLISRHGDAITLMALVAVTKKLTNSSNKYLYDLSCEGNTAIINICDK